MDVETGSVGGTEIPAVQASASRMANGELTVTAANLSMTESKTVTLTLAGMKPESACGMLLTGEAHAHNTFDAPETVKEEPLQVSVTADGIQFVLPACGVASLHLK